MYGWCDDFTFTIQSFYPAFESETTNARLIAECNICWCLLFDLVYHLPDVTGGVFDGELDNLLIARI